MQPHRAREAKDRVETFGSGKGRKEGRNPPGDRSAQPTWEITETSTDVKPPGLSMLRAYHLLRLVNSQDTPFFDTPFSELNNTFDDEASEVDLMIPAFREATPKRKKSTLATCTDLTSYRFLKRLTMQSSFTRFQGLKARPGMPSIPW